MHRPLRCALVSLTHVISSRAASLQPLIFWYHVFLKMCAFDNCFGSEQAFYLKNRRNQDIWAIVINLTIWAILEINQKILRMVWYNVNLRVCLSKPCKVVQTPIPELCQSIKLHVRNTLKLKKWSGNTIPCGTTFVYLEPLGSLLSKHWEVARKLE